MSERLSTPTLYIVGFRPLALLSFDLFMEALVFKWLAGGTDKNDWFFVLWWCSVILIFVRFCSFVSAGIRNRIVSRGSLSRKTSYTISSKERTHKGTPRCRWRRHARTGVAQLEDAYALLSVPLYY